MDNHPSWGPQLLPEAICKHSLEHISNRVGEVGPATGPEKCKTSRYKQEYPLIQIRWASAQGVSYRKPLALDVAKFPRICNANQLEQHNQTQDTSSSNNCWNFHKNLSLVDRFQTQVAPKITDSFLQFLTRP